MRSGTVQRPVGVALLVVGLAVVAGVASAGAGDVRTGARAGAMADRGAQVQLAPIPPPTPPPCERVIVIGDSLTQNWSWWLVNGLRDAGFVGRVDAHHTRRIPASSPVPYSGVRAAWSVRATWGEADCWVIALGSNDLARGADNATTDDALIAEMLAAVTPGARVWWVNVDYHSASWFDFARATAIFNARLDARAATDEAFEVIDWYSYAEANLHWFFDPVHVNETGTKARSAQIVAALPS